MERGEACAYLQLLRNSVSRMKGTWAVGGVSQGGDGATSLGFGVPGEDFAFSCSEMQLDEPRGL